MNPLSDEFPVPFFRITQFSTVGGSTKTCAWESPGGIRSVSRMPDLRSAVGLVQTIAYQEFDFVLAYVMALFCFMLLLF